jgi:hypothetical protein
LGLFVDYFEQKIDYLVEFSPVIKKNAYFPIPLRRLAQIVADLRRRRTHIGQARTQMERSAKLN